VAQYEDADYGKIVACYLKMLDKEGRRMTEKDEARLGALYMRWGFPLVSDALYKTGERGVAASRILGYASKCIENEAKRLGIQPANE
jgi:hypothetical protein